LRQLGAKIDNEHLVMMQGDDVMELIFCQYKLVPRGKDLRLGDRPKRRKPRPMNQFSLGLPPTLDTPRTWATSGAYAAAVTLAPERR
jgi:hypothetical protein